MRWSIALLFAAQAVLAAGEPAILAQRTAAVLHASRDHRARLRMKRVLAALGVSCATLCFAASPAQQPAFTAEQVKAGFLYHFAAFVDWPESTPTDPVVIGLLGGEEVEAELRRIVAVKRTPGRSITVRRLQPGEDLSGIHIVYVSAAESQRLERVIAAARAGPTLVVSDTADGLERGATINFVTADRVQFEISLEAAHRGGLRVSARLLSVAVRVKRSRLTRDSAYV